MGVRSARIKGLLEEIRALLETAKGNYFRASYYGELFVRWHALREELKASDPNAFSGLSSKAVPEPTPSPDWDGEGHFARGEFLGLERQAAHALEVSIAMDSEGRGEPDPVPAARVGRLSVQSIGRVRALLEQMSRAEIQQVLIEAGSEPAFHMSFTDNMNSAEYRSKARMLSEGFDSPARHPETGQAFVFEVVRVTGRRDPDEVAGGDAGLDAAFRRDGLSLAEVLGHARPDVGREVQSYLEQRDLIQAAELHAKQWSRVETDPSGAVTAAASAFEAVIVHALDELEIERQGVNQLPNLLDLLSRETNFDDLLPHGDKGQRFMKSIRGFAHNAYALAHDAGDRHAGNPSSTTEQETAYVYVSSCDVVMGILIRALRSGRIRRSG